MVENRAERITIEDWAADVVLAEAQDTIFYSSTSVLFCEKKCFFLSYT